MPFEIVTIPCLADNYAFLAHDPKTGATALVDVPEAAPILAMLQNRNWTLTDVILTHHHWDHVDGLPDLLAGCATRPRIIGAATDAHRLPPLDLAVHEGDHITIGTQTADIYDVSGHTIGHIAIHFPSSDALFTADSLMALGCGRLFEGTPEQMYESLAKLKTLAPQTVVYSGHEYTQSNARFALTIEPNNRDLILRCEDIETARAQNRPTVPSTLALECATNPFLRCDLMDLKSAIGMSDASGPAVFAHVRALKDRF